MAAKRKRSKLKRIRSWEILFCCVDRWNTESVKLHTALQRIAETIRYNERTLREVAEGHSQQLGAVADTL